MDGWKKSHENRHKAVPTAEARPLPWETRFSAPEDYEKPP